MGKIIVLMTPEGKRVVVNREKDECIYASPQNPPNTGMTYTRGIDLYRHVSRKGNEYYYTYSWSMWQGEESSYQLISKDQAREFLLDRAGVSGWAALNEEEVKRIKELGFDIFEEDA